MLARSEYESRCQIVQLREAREQIVTQAQIECQTPGGLPIVLKKKSVFPVAKVPFVGSQLRRLPSQETRIDPGILAGGLVNREEQLVEEVVRRSTHVRVAVLHVPPNFRPRLQAVLAVTQRDHVHVVIDILVKYLWVAVIGTEASRTVREANVWHAWQVNPYRRSVFRVPGPELVQQYGSEIVNVAELKIGGLGG